MKDNLCKFYQFLLVNIKKIFSTETKENIINIYEKFTKKSIDILKKLKDKIKEIYQLAKTNIYKFYKYLIMNSKKIFSKRTKVKENIINNYKKFTKKTRNISKKIGNKTREIYISIKQTISSFNKTLIMKYKKLTVKKPKKKVVKKQTLNKQVAIKKSNKIAPVITSNKKAKKVIDTKKTVEKEVELKKYTWDTVLLYFLIIFAIGLFVGYIPFWGSSKPVKNEVSISKECSYSEWIEVDSNYCLVNSNGIAYEGEIVKYVLNNETGLCQKYVRKKTCI